MKRPTRRRQAAFAATGVVLVAGAAVLVRAQTSPTSGIEPAEHASSSACTGADKAYPGHVAGKERDDTDQPGVAAWGGGQVIWRCGLTPIRPTLDPCFNVNGVDWVLRQAKSTGGKKVLITYGRKPAVEVTVKDGTDAVDGVLVDVSRMAKPLPKYSKCLGADDAASL